VSPARLRELGFFGLQEHRLTEAKEILGDLAPDFSLTTLDKTAAVQLSGLAAQARPVVLIFGSYT